MNGKSCFFIGHREASSELLPLLNEAIEAHITQYGVTNFIAGHYGGFDLLAAKTVIAAKKCHPKITLSLLLPYHPAERSIKLPAGFDDMIYPDGLETVPRKYAIVRANRHTIEHVDYLISYVWHPASNARNLLEFAQRREMSGLIQITNLASLHSSYEHFQRRLEVYGMNQSAFIRKALSDAIIRPVIVASLVNDDLLAALGKLTAEYGRIGNNLNQIARHLNEWQAPYPDLAKELRDAAVDLATLKFDVMKKVGDTLGNVQTYQL